MRAAAAGCPGAAAVRARWTPRSLAGATLDLALAWACLCLAALAALAAAVLARLGLPLPCTCARPHLPCLHAFLALYPSRALDSIRAALLARPPFAAADTPIDADDEDDEPGAADADAGADPGREAARDDLRRELEKERSAAASAAEEAMAMILRLQKEKSALEIDARQQRRTADERCAFFEDELEELRDILLMRDREARALRKEVDAYRRLLGLGPQDDDDDGDEEEEMVTPSSIMPEGEPSSSKSADRNSGVAQLGISDSVFSFKTPFLREDLVPSPLAGHVKGVNEDSLVVQTPGQVPVIEPKMELDSSEGDGAETVEIHPLSTRSLDQGGIDSAAGTEAMEQQNADDFQEVQCGVMDKINQDHTGCENDANIYDVHVVDDICFPTEVKGLISRSFSDATMQADRLQIRVAADEALGKSLNAIKGAQAKIRLAASERRQSLHSQLLEDIANQLQEIKDAAEVDRHLYSASPKNSKKK